MAALGVAIASAIAQWLSALLIMRHLMSQKDACRVHLKKLCIDKAAAKRVLMIGIPSGLQNAILCRCKPLRTDRRQQLRFGDGIR